MCIEYCRLTFVLKAPFTMSCVPALFPIWRQGYHLDRLLFPDLALPSAAPSCLLEGVFIADVLIYNFMLSWQADFEEKLRNEMDEMEVRHSRRPRASASCTRLGFVLCHTF